MVAILIFILITLNLGTIAVSTTRIANAADSAALYLASQLSTRSHYLYKALGNKTKKCKGRGFGAIIGAIILAIISIITFQPEGLAAAVAVGTAAGAVGGAIGAAIEGSNIFQGMILGAQIGAAIGGLYGYGHPATAGKAGASLGSAAAESAAASAEASSESAYGYGHPATAGKAGASLGSAAAESAAASAGALVDVGVSILGAGAGIYNLVEADRQFSALVSSLARQINGSGNAETSLREGAIFQALSQVVDDPNQIQDLEDIDIDHDYSEKIPYFYYWFYKRGKVFKETLPPIERTIEAFLKNDSSLAETMSQFAYSAYSNGGSLSREEIEGSDGSIVSVFRALYQSGFANDIFWKPGPAKEQIANCNCGDDENCTCPSLPGYDELDDLVDELQFFWQLVDGGGVDEESNPIDPLRKQDTYSLAREWNSWMGFFYDPEETEEGGDDYYTVFTDAVEGNSQKGTVGLYAWKEEIENVKKKLPSCQFKCLSGTGKYYPCTYQEAVNNAGAKVANPVCYTGGAWGNLIDFGSIDEDMDDEFKIAETDIDDIINHLNSFKESAKDAYTEMNNVKVAGGINEWGGENPVTYSWRDSRGEHSVSVEVSKFKIPKLKKKKSFFKVCVYIKHKEGKVWVSIKREDPANKEISAGGIFSFLGNPFSSSNNIEIWRTGHAEFHYKHVKLEKGGREW